jgi:hypothetical protein
MIIKNLKTLTSHGNYDSYIDYDGFNIHFYLRNKSRTNTCFVVLIMVNPN